MGRTKQRLINFHTSGLTSIPVASDVHYGEIVVRHNEQQPELLIKVSESEFAVIPGSGAVTGAISVAAKTLENKIESVDGRVNTVSGDLNTFKTYVANTYETKTDVTDAITAAKDSVYLSATTTAAADAKEKADAAQTAAINAAAASAVTLLGLVDGVDGRVDTVSGDLNTFKTDVANTYETKDNVSTAITAAKDSVYLSATTVAAADAKEKADAAYSSATTAAAASATTLQNKIEAVDGRVNTVSGDLNTFKTDVANTYETKNNVTTAITAAKDSVYLSATTVAAADAKEKADAAQTAAINAAAASAKTLSDKIDGVDSKVGTLSGNVETAIENLETELTNAINTKVSAAYRYFGSCTYANLPASGSVIGEVWNVTDAHDNVPGTNYAWDGEKWDALGGTIDLAPYALKTEVTAATKNLQDKIDTANGRIDTVSGNLNTFKTTVANTYETKDNVTSYITAAKDAVYSSATTAASADAESKANKAKDDAIAAAAASANTLQNNIDAVNNSVTGLSASTVTIQGVANSAIQTASIVDSATCKVSVNKVGTELKFDFSNLVIDCGEF